MIDLLERTTPAQPVPWPPAAYYALAADVRTEVAESWQAAEELARIGEELMGDTGCLQLHETLTQLLNALNSLDVEVEQVAVQALDAADVRRCWSRYAETAALAQAAAQVAEGLSATQPAAALAQPSFARLQRAIPRLRRHIDALGDLVAHRRLDAS